MRRRIEVEDLTLMMRDNEKAIEHAERQRRNREEIEGSNHLSMIVEKCQPTLGLHVVSALLQPLQIARHSGFRYLESELQEFTVDARRAPPADFHGSDHQFHLKSIVDFTLGNHLGA